MLKDKIIELLRQREFLHAATADADGRPYVAPKFLLKVDELFIYLIDYTRGRTVENLRINPQVSLSFVDIETLNGYQFNGSAELIEKGEVYDKALQELRKKKMELSVERIIEGIHTEKVHGSFELEIPEKFVVIKIKIQEVVRIGPRGEVLTVF